MDRLVHGLLLAIRVSELQQQCAENRHSWEMHLLCERGLATMSPVYMQGCSTPMLRRPVVDVQQCHYYYYICLHAQFHLIEWCIIAL